MKTVEYIAYLERTHKLSGKLEIVCAFVEADCLQSAKSSIYWIYGDLIDILLIEEWDYKNDTKYDKLVDEYYKCK